MKKSILFILSLSLVACQNSDTPQESESAPQADHSLLLSSTQLQTSNFTTQKPLRKRFSEEINCTGNTEVAPKYQAEVSPYYGGYVVETDLLSGQEVQAGQVLFYLQDPLFIDLQEEYLRVKAQFDWQKEDLERKEALIDKQAISAKDLSERKMAFLEVEARWHALQKKLALLNINAEQLRAHNLSSRVAVRAPISGLISEVNLSKGKYLAPGELALKIIDRRHLHLGIQIFEQDLSKVKIGQDLLFRPQASPAWQKATVRLIDPTLKAERGIAMLHADIVSQDSKENLSPGMYVEARILSNSDSLHALPIEALVEKEDQSFFVYQAKQTKDGGLKLTEVAVKPRARDSRFFSAAELDPETLYLCKGAFRISGLN